MYICIRLAFLTTEQKKNVKRKKSRELSPPLLNTFRTFEDRVLIKFRNKICTQT